MATIQFNGVTKCIGIVLGVSELEATIDIQDLYSLWKEWVLESDNAKYLPAFDGLGGNQVSTTEYLGRTFIIKNDWKICPIATEDDTKIILNGNIFPEVAGTPIISYAYMNPLLNTHVENRSSLLPSLSIIETGTSGLTATESALLEKIAKLVTLIPAAL